MRLSMLLAVARAEIRSTRRLVRYWMFAGLSVGITLLIYLYYAGIHGFVSRFSATIGAVAPRYLMGPMGIYLMLIFLLGLIFLAFDVRARDERERVAEVLDSRPVSNPELLVGRGIGLVLMALAPVLVVTVVMQTFGSAAPLFGWYLGEPVEPYSLVSFILDAVSTFALWCVVVMLLAVLLRNRLLVALAALILVGVQFWLAFQLPLYLQGIVSLILNFNLASDLAPSLGTSAVMAKRLALLVMAAGGISLAAAMHPRPDGGSRLSASRWAAPWLPSAVSSSSPWPSRRRPTWTSAPVGWPRTNSTRTTRAPTCGPWRERCASSQVEVSTSTWRCEYRRRPIPSSRRYCSRLIQG